MGSLFDIAAGLSQYEEGAKDNNSKQKIHPQSALGILDETFETIYSSRQYRSTTRNVPLLRSTSMVQLQPTRLSESKSSDALDTRLRRFASFKSPTPATERRVSPAIAVAGLIIPPPPAVPPPFNNVTKQNKRQDPDVTAKAVLREVTSEIDQLMVTSTTSTEEEESQLRMLSEKYADSRLSKLPGTPFVLLVRKKVAQKLQQLEHHLHSRRESNKMENENNNSPPPINSIPSVKSLQKLTPAQQEMLQNLLRLPEKQLLKLPKAQLELVQFAKRFDKLVKATPDQLQHLPIEHQQLVRFLQRQQKQLRTDECR
ncbi:hypothetical protein F441_21639 [Phytophthora nicotianae CJ01A1]|uniref:Uncharacterized protein n=3 Tax=Phytophthora nicotianae TaxID=4792 RepID=V9DWK3_PHYNI|nr:hypothetical protein F443_21752 [Phytophthora nicotianae P1569]ETK71622.1 hypothetical protein L915_21151 [Phytophthora nicotianae]ETL25057.1 hypothetical protein L916_21026 [Phytophthora nicotianae]ETM31537.1 hypothetical protein L914_20896 [Phytophthora nicotianae]ETP01041.1 hypothetical protein F441_21639 [Phytophthora nicotianae CJ01A1]